MCVFFIQMHLNFVWCQRNFWFKSTQNLLWCFCIFYIIVSHAAKKTKDTCENITLEEGMDYCAIPLSLANCYIKKAFRYRLLHPTRYLPLWVELCVFPVPDFFYKHQSMFSCQVLLETGPVSCLVTKEAPDHMNNFTRNCSVTLMWQEKKSHPNEQMRRLITSKMHAQRK